MDIPKKTTKITIPRGEQSEDMRRMSSPIPIDGKKQNTKSTSPSPTPSPKTSGSFQDFMKNMSPKPEKLKLDVSPKSVIKIEPSPKQNTIHTVKVEKIDPSPKINTIQTVKTEPKKSDVKDAPTKMTKEEKTAFYAQQAAQKREKQKAGGGSSQPQVTSQPSPTVTSGSLPKSKGILQAQNMPVPSKKDVLSINVSIPPKKDVKEKKKSSSQSELFSEVDDWIPEESRPHIPVNSETIHSSILKFGIQYSQWKLKGTNEVCVALLNALKDWVVAYKADFDKPIPRDLELKIKAPIGFISSCRPLSAAMGNCIKWFKTQFQAVPSQYDEQVAKDFLVGQIEQYISEKITFTVQEIIKHGKKKISNDDVILTYARSETVEKILLACHNQGTRFRVILVDSTPREEGFEMLSCLTEAGIDVSFIQLNAISYIMKEVTKVFLGAQSMLTNGSVVSRLGTASIALVAREFIVPVVVCCETYKFSEKSQIDSLTKNELGDPMELLGKTSIEFNENLSVLNLIYDVTPNEFVDMVITEIGVIPPSSVAVVMREYSKSNRK